MGDLICFGACIFCFLLFAGLGTFVMFSKTPTNFWSGDKFSPEDVSDVKKYNRANAIMWIVYGALYLIPAIVSLFNVLVAGLFIFLLTFIGVPVLIVIYTKVIRPKYMEA